ncbi:DUF411 domain-containing protein [uncultured Nitratireductor sp.]|uniref:DUF411 domain-containing protein n=1 Tax=uncultured Nitratireductor sp. TaxID=520953 RepID=UPI0025CF801B|nr:DUF411 domain-containing protein [uncultured Nitratireductor sp.]
MNKRTCKLTAGAALAVFLTSGLALAASASADKTITVFKTPWCGCCELWVEAMQEAGYTMKTTDLEELSRVKDQAGVPGDLEACHTAVTGGERKYVLEGHVPVEAVQKLLSEQPGVKGIAVPGMPAGSPGMGYDPDARYTVYSFDGSSDGNSSVFLEAGME